MLYCPVKGDCHPVDLRDQDIALPQQRPLDHGGTPLGRSRRSARCWGGRPEFSLMEGELHAALLRQLEGVADPFVIRVHPHHA